MSTACAESRPPGPPLRVLQWPTGHVAHETVRAILDRGDLELVRCHAHGASKTGTDVADLVDPDAPIGSAATSDVKALLAPKPDCAVEHGSLVEVDANRHIGMKLDIPEFDDPGRPSVDAMYAFGMSITAPPHVSAIAKPCAAEPGIRACADRSRVTTSLAARWAGA